MTSRLCQHSAAKFHSFALRSLAVVPSKAWPGIKAGGGAGPAWPPTLPCSMSSVESVKVAVRVRPYNGREKDANSKCIIRVRATPHHPHCVIRGTCRAPTHRHTCRRLWRLTPLTPLTPHSSSRPASHASSTALTSHRSLRTPRLSRLPPPAACFARQLRTPARL